MGLRFNDWLLLVKIMNGRTLSEILIEVDTSTTLDELTKLSSELTDSELPSGQKLFGLEHIIEHGKHLKNQLEIKHLFDE